MSHGTAADVFLNVTHVRNSLKAIYGMLIYTDISI